MRLRYKILLILTVLGTMFGLGRCQRLTISGPKLSVPAVLPANDKEQILVDPKHNSLIIVTAKGSQTLSLPNRRSVIDIHTNGSVSVTAPQSGFEALPFMGVNVSDKLRVAIGADMFYLKRLDLGVGLMDQLSTASAPKVFVMVSYTVWSNTRVGLSFDSSSHVGLGVTVRL